MKLDFSKFRVLVVGDVMLDEYVFGEVNRISPEAPIPVFQKNNNEYRLGGAANVALNISTLGAESVLLSVVGNDTQALKIKQQSEEKKIECHFITDNSRPTTLKQRFLAKGQHILRIDEEVTNDINRDIGQEMILTFKELNSKKQIDAVIFQDYNKGVLNPYLIKNIIKYCKSNEILTIVDPKFKNLKAFSGCSIIKPNLLELEKALSKKIDPTESELKQAVALLKESLVFDTCYVTLGAKGVYSSLVGQVSAVEKKQVLDVTGAGDAVISIICLATLANVNYQKIPQLCNAAGIAVCQNLGTYGISVDDIFVNN